MFRGILGSALRVSEIVNCVHPRDTDPKGFVTVRAETCKTNRERLVRVTPEFLPYYRVWLQRIPEGPLVADPLTRAPYSRFALRRMVKAVMRESGIGYRPQRKEGMLSTHDLRHTWATWELASRRLNLIEVQQQLGHTDANMTQDFYLHCVTEMLYQDDKTPKWRSAALGQFAGESLSGAPRLKVV